jgi:hypothetical protein
MKKNLFLLFLTNLLILTAFSQEQYSRAKIWTNTESLNELSNLGLAIDHSFAKKNTFVISDFSETEIQKAKDAGFKVDILIEDVKSFYVERAYQNTGVLKNETCPENAGSSFDPTVPTNFGLGSMGGFYTYQEYLDILDDMYAQFPNLITQRSAVSDTLSHEGRELFYVKMSNDPTADQGKPRVLYSSLHHAREPGSLAQTIFFMWYMLENYGTNPEVTYLMDNLEIFCIPMVNPDGYVHNVVNDPNGGGMHRKNKNPNVGTNNPGVDLNRNYSYQWGTTGVDLGDENSDVYPGSGPFSEPETQNMKKIAENWGVSFAFNAHTHGGLLLYPIGATNQEFAVDNDYFDAYSNHMAKFNNYDAIKSSGLYPASGDSDDYMYKDEGIFAVTPEVGFNGFWPPVNQINPDCIDMLFPNLVMAHLPLVYGATEDTDLASTIVDMTGNFNHQIQRLGQQNGTLTVSIDPLTGIQSVGNAINYNLVIEEIQTGSISYNLDPAIQYGDEIKYVLITDNGDWQKRDTIVKTFGDATLQFSDDAANADNWTGDWSLTSEDFFSPDFSFTDSPNNEYSNNEYSTYTFNDTINLTDATAALTRFRAKWAIESGYDYVQLQVSTDYGNTWTAQCGKYTRPGVSNWGDPQPAGEPLYDGTENSWVLEEISLTDYLGEEIMFRFILVSDQGVTDDGFYFDDFEILYDEPTDASLDENNLSNFKLIPNPSNDKVQIALNQYTSNGSVSIIDATGKIIDRVEISQQTNTIPLNVSNYDQGVYFVRVTIEGETAQPQRMVVVH